MPYAEPNENPLNHARKSWGSALRDAMIVGSFASLTSAAALALRGREETGHAVSTLNAPSHWVWGERAVWRDDTTLRYTAAGFGIHHASSIFWAVAHEKTRRVPLPPAENAFASHLKRAALTTALAAFVDLRVVPGRLTPGFERRLSVPSLALVYGLFAVGLAVGSYLVNRPSSQKLQKSR